MEQTGANTPISVGDAAALSGLDLNTARESLMTLASLTGGDLEVTYALLSSEWLYGHHRALLYRQMILVALTSDTLMGRDVSPLGDI